MNHSPLTLRDLGWSDWFAERARPGPAETVARVAAVDREQAVLVDPSGHFRAKLAGGFRHRNRLPQEQPCVGDWVIAVKQPGDDFAIIHSLLERRTCLRRKAAGDVMESQMIAANLDVVMIVQSCHFDFNVKRLERYLLMVMEGGAEPCILLTKTDLVEPPELESMLAEIQAFGIGAPILPLSNMTRAGLEDLQRRLRPGKTYCFVGSSGVGKTTLINRLTGNENLETGAVSGTGEGRHTTVRRELIRLDTGALVIDNPGMREFGMIHAEREIGNRFSNITALASLCRFRDCSHAGESGCAVLAAVNTGEIRPEHLENYLKLRKETAFNDMSYSEKRRKDRDFGRFIKKAKKNASGP